MFRCVSRVVSSALRPVVAPRCIATLPSASPFRRFGTSPFAPAPPSAPAKLSTRITGLDVVPNGREVFIGLQKEILASLQEYNDKLGFEPKFNNVCRRLAEHRLKISEEEDEVEFIEQRLFMGQIEQLIEIAENELDLIVAMNEEVKPWEPMSAEDKAYWDLMSSPQFGEDPEAFKNRTSSQMSAEDKAEVEKFFAEMDEEIKEDQQREAEERAARKAKKAAAATR